MMRDKRAGMGIGFSSLTLSSPALGHRKPLPVSPPQTLTHTFLLAMRARVNIVPLHRQLSPHSLPLLPAPHHDPGSPAMGLSCPSSPDLPALEYRPQGRGEAEEAGVQG